jgi:hypothetical protein
MVLQKEVSGIRPEINGVNTVFSPEKQFILPFCWVPGVDKFPFFK